MLPSVEFPRALHCLEHEKEAAQKEYARLTGYVDETRHSSYDRGPKSLAQVGCGNREYEVAAGTGQNGCWSIRQNVETGPMPAPSG
ncbi:hypothetical protein GCM10027563_12850 [Parasphingorhabdus pacifica]